MTGDLSTLPQITATALAALGDGVRDFLEGGAGEERTLARNTAAFDDWAFRPRLMSGLGEPSPATRFMGVDLDLPLLVGPLGADRLFHPDGQKAVARAAAKAGIASMAPEAGSFSLETLRAEAPAAVRFGQLHPTGTEANFRRMLGRFEDAGFDAVVVTCDCAVAGWRERNLRNGFTPPQDAGATAIGVSNHGGRQLDGLPAALDALPGIAAAVGEQAQISFDGGAGAAAWPTSTKRRSNGYEGTAGLSSGWDGRPRRSARPPPASAP